MKIIGNTVGTPMPRSNYHQTDPRRADYIKGKEDLDAKFAGIQDGLSSLDKSVKSLQETEANTTKTLADILADIADLKYVPIAFAGISNNVGTKELGQVFDTVKVTWSLNKDPESQTVQGSAVDAAARSVEIPGPFSSDKTFTVTATDERGHTAKESTSISFQNGVYYGALAVGVLPDSAAVLKLTRKLQSGLGASIPWTPSDGKRPSYACPALYGTPKFTIGPNEYEWTKLGTFLFENASGYKENYDVWQHPRDITESVTIGVS